MLVHRSDAIIAGLQRGFEMGWVRLITLAVTILLYASTCGSAFAGLTFCNKTLKDIYISIIEFESSEWVTKGWWKATAAGGCVTPVGGLLTARYYYFYGARSDRARWQAESTDPTGARRCIGRGYDSFTRAGTYRCIGDTIYVYFERIDTGEKQDYTVNLTFKGENPPEIQIGTIQERCLVSWDDSHQVHSVRTIIEWNYQAVKTRMKKLRHCIKLKVTGPVDVGGVAKQYVEKCIDVALNDSKTLYMIQGLIALAGDINGGGGSLSAANAYAYIDHVKTTAISCLTDTGRIESYLKDVLSGKFDATVQKESHWEYWDL